MTFEGLNSRVKPRNCIASHTANYMSRVFCLGGSAPRGARATPAHALYTRPKAGDTVTVGTVLRHEDSNRPPVQIPACRSTALGSHLGSSSKALIGPGMDNADSGNPSCDKAIHTRPVETPALASSPKRFIPSLIYCFSKCAQGMDVGGYAVIRVVSADHSLQPASLLHDGLVQTSPHFESDLSNFTPQSGTHRTTHRRTSINFPSLELPQQCANPRKLKVGGAPESPFL